jgi:hypothetical protein
VVDVIVQTGCVWLHGTFVAVVVTVVATQRASADTDGPAASAAAGNIDNKAAAVTATCLKVLLNISGAPLYWQLTFGSDR